MGWTYNAPEGTVTGGPQIAAVALAFNGFSLILVCLRVYVRIWIVNGFGHDDWMILVSWVGACVCSTCTVIQTKYGLGLATRDDVPLENLYTFGLIQYIGAPFYVIGVWGFKMSLLLCYLRFFPGGYRTAAIIIAAFCTIAHIAFICVSLFFCIPLEQQWNPNVTWGHCGNIAIYYLSMSGITIFLDLMVIGLPFPVLLKSQIPLRRKVALLFLFALGIFVTGCQIIRILMIKSLADYLHYAHAIVWSIIETNVGIVTTSLPTLGPLCKYFSEKSRAGTRSVSKKPESRYALHTWKEEPNALGSHGNHEIQITGLCPGDSTERILDIEGIMKRMDVVVTRQKIHDSKTGERDERTEEEQFGLQYPSTSATTPMHLGIAWNQEERK
ncbi:hypothetical protein F5Y05DRAFT_109232 [Hypoxylon sp. FL0543]|nr:hypothetical protein F5Y05DRAFT_109232 [Hypoxylon sp. FL0543]